MLIEIIAPAAALAASTICDVKVKSESKRVKSYEWSSFEKKWRIPTGTKGAIYLEPPKGGLDAFTCGYLLRTKHGDFESSEIVVFDSNEKDNKHLVIGDGKDVVTVIIDCH